MSKSISATDYKLLNSFEALRQQLLAADSVPHADRPLAYWALPVDRRLPLALLGCSLRQLLDMPYPDIAATPGIGHKKLAMLLTLMERVSSSNLERPNPIDPPLPSPLTCSAQSEAADSASETAMRGNPVDAGTEFDSTLVSETHWDRWRETVRCHQLEQEALGRVCVSLRHLPTVIWRTSLATYLPLSLAEIRRLRTHGEKRVRAVLRVFFEIDQALGGIPRHATFAVRLVPRNLEQVETWFHELLTSGTQPSAADLRQNLALPLLNQIQIDGGETVAGLAERRLAIESPGLSVRNESNRLGVTRARIYQLLDVCGKIMEVRWPAGRWALQHLTNHLAQGRDTADLAALTAAVRALYFPELQSDEQRPSSATVNPTVGDTSTDSDEVVAENRVIV